MRALRPLWREAQIAYLTWARAEMGPLHRDLPAVVRRLNELLRERPPTKPRSRCEMTRGCMQDEACPDFYCPAHPWETDRA